MPAAKVLPSALKHRETHGRGRFQTLRPAVGEIPEIEVPFQVGGRQPSAVGAGGQRAHHAVVDGVERAEVLGVGGVDRHELPTQPSGRILAHEDRQHDAALAGKGDRPQLGLPGDQGGLFRAIGLFVRLVEHLGLPLAAFPEDGGAAGVLRRQPLAVGGKRQRTHRLPMAFQNLAQAAVERIDQQDFAQRSHGAIAAEGQQAVVGRGAERIDAAAQTAGDLPANRPLTKEHAADIAGDGPEVPHQNRSCRGRRSKAGWSRA